MSAIKRYGNWCLVTHGHEMLEAVDGNYVLFDDHQRELAAYQAAMPEEPPLWYGGAFIAKPDYDALAKRCARLTVELEAARKDAERLKHLHDDPKRAQAYFWNHQGRNERNAAIDTALTAGKEGA